MADLLHGTLDLLILKALARQRNHGFGITLYVEEASEGLLKVEEGSLYPALHRLERQKLISAEWGVTENGRRARFYQLTAPGKKRLVEAEAAWTRVTKGVAKMMRFA